MGSPFLQAPWVTVAGYPLWAIAPGWGDLKVTHRWPGGCWQLDWTVPVNKLRRHQALISRAPVQAFYGATPIFAGFLAEPDWDTGAMVAVGSVRRGEEALCIDDTGILSTVIDDVVDRGIEVGILDWIRRESIASTPFVAGNATDKFNYVGALLDAKTNQDGTNWGVNARRELEVAATATTPTWTVAPDSGVMGLADQNLIGTAWGRFLSAPNRIESAFSGKDGPEVGFDLTTRLGVTTREAAEAFLAGLREQGQARSAWTNGLTLTAPQITGPGGNRANLASIRGNQGVRLQGVRDLRGLDAGTNFVIGESVWDVADRSIAVSPMGLVDHSLQGLAEDNGVKVL